MSSLGDGCSAQRHGDLPTRRPGTAWLGATSTGVRGGVKHPAYRVTIMVQSG